ncbi:MAG: mannosyltransferase family protein [Chloroflexota bacterium]
MNAAAPAGGRLARVARLLFRARQGLTTWIGEHQEVARASRLYLLLFAGLTVAGVASVEFDRPTRVQGTWLHLLMRANEPNPELVKIWERWDALWYMRIAQSGYTAHDGTTAFFPLYPALMRLAAGVLRENYALAGLIVSGIALVAALVVFQRLAQHLVGPDSARRAVLYTILYPTGFFFFAPYTESIFLLVVVATFWSMERRRWAAAGLFGLLAGLARAQGALLMLPMLWEWLDQRRRGERRSWPSFLFGIAPGVGLLLFTAYVRFVVGQPQAGLATQANWGYHVVLPWQALSASLSRVRLDPVEALNFASLALFAILTIASIRRLPLTYVLYNAANLGVILTREMNTWPLMSVSRYVLVLFPGFLMLGLLGRRTWLHQAICTLGLLMLAVLFYQYVHFRFVA